MNGLAWVFVVKIAVTLAGWCGPLLLVSSATLVSLGIPVGANQMFVRLLGWAYLSLCVGYAMGLMSILNGERALGAVTAGIVSNAGASALLAYFGFSGAWSEWSAVLRVLLWTSMLVTATIAVLLYLYGIRGAPAHPRTFVSAETAQAAVASAPRADRKRFRRDMDAVVDQDPTPRV